MIVVDASVFNKLFLNEPDRPQAQALFNHAIRNDVPLMAPHLLLYEILTTALHYQVPFDKVVTLLGLQRDAGMRLIEPSLHVLMRAQEIARAGGPKSGYPSLQDSIYHALALQEGGVFVTADRRHFAKAKSFGAIVMLSEYPL